MAEPARLLRTLALLGGLCTAQQPGAHPGTEATLDYLSARIAGQPDSQLLYHQRGVAYLHDGQYQNALRDLQRAATLGDPAAVGFHLGVVYRHLMEPEAARASLDAYLEYAPGHPGALLQRAELLVERGDPASALEDYRALLAAAESAGPATYLAAADLMAGSPEHGVDAAIRLLDRGMARLGPVPLLQQRAVALESGLGRYDRAIKRLEAMAPEASDNPHWRVEMGRLLLTAGREEQAYPHLATARRQLAELRTTPARVQLSQELDALLAQLSVARDSPDRPQDHQVLLP